MQISGETADSPESALFAKKLNIAFGAERVNDISVVLPCLISPDGRLVGCSR